MMLCRDTAQVQKPMVPMAEERNRGQECLTNVNGRC